MQFRLSWDLSMLRARPQTHVSYMMMHLQPERIACTGSFARTYNHPETHRISGIQGIDEGSSEHDILSTLLQDACKQIMVAAAARIKCIQLS